MDEASIASAVKELPGWIEGKINNFKRTAPQSEKVVITPNGRIRIFSDEDENVDGLAEAIRSKYEATLPGINQTSWGCVRLAIESQRKGVTQEVLTTGVNNRAKLVFSQHAINSDEFDSGGKKYFVGVDFSGGADRRPEVAGKNNCDRIVLVAKSKESLLEKCQAFYDSEGPWHVMSNEEMNSYS